MSTLPLMRSKHLNPFAAVLRKQGESVERLLRLTQLPANCLRDPETLIPVGAASSFRELCERRTGLADIALVATEHSTFADLGGLGTPLLGAPTLQRSLEQFRGLVATQSSNVTVQLQPLPGGHLMFCHRAMSEISAGEWHRALYTLAWMLKVVRLVDPAWSPAEILVDSKASPQRYDAIEKLGSVARFGEHYTGFIVPAAMLALPPAKNSTAENERNAKDGQLLKTSPGSSYAETLRQLLRSYASDGWLSIERASEVADTSVRTMQRRLKSEQTTYSKVVEHTRTEIAGELLEDTDATIAEIARQLGYEYPGDFTRAFRRWAGVSPSAFRQQRRAPVG